MKHITLYVSIIASSLLFTAGVLSGWEREHFGPLTVISMVLILIAAPALGWLAVKADEGHK